VSRECRFRVAHVSTQRGMRGGENQVLMLMRGLRERDIENVLYSPPGSPLAERAADEGFEARAVPLRSEADVPSMLALARGMRLAGVAVAHFHDGHAVTLGGAAAWFAGLSARVATRRTVFPLRSGWKWRRLARRVIAISGAVERLLLEGGVAPARIRVVRSAVDASRLEGRDADRARASLDLPRTARVITCAAALTGEKGHEDLLVAMSRVAPAFPDAVLLIAGEGELEGALRERARGLRLGDCRVRFLGRREDLADILAASSLFVMPSHREGLGTAVLEAMWCGVPVVATDAGGLPEAVGECGRLVPVGDARALAAAIELALGRPKESRTLARKGQERTRRLFSADAMVDGTLAVYEELRRSRARPSRVRPGTA
jgi:glycosyltransferase involved in cell wall biosynthesis